MRKTTFKVLIFLPILLCLFFILFKVIRMNHPQIILTENISFSIDGKYLCVSTSKKNFLWNIYDDNKTVTYATDALHSSVFLSPDSRYMVNIKDSERSYFSITDIQKNQIIMDDILGDFRGFSSPNEVLFYKSGQINIFDLNDKSLNVINPDRINKLESDSESDYFLKEYIHGNDSISVYKNEKNNKLILTNSDFRKEIMKRKIEIDEDVSCVDEDAIAIAGEKVFIFKKRGVKVVDMSNSSIKKIIFENELSDHYREEFCVSNNGEWIGYVNEPLGNTSVKIVDVDMETKISEVPISINRNIYFMALNSKTEKLAVGFQALIGRGIEGKVVIYDTHTKKLYKEPVMK